MSTQMDYAAIRRNLDGLRQSRSKIKVFGAEGHGFILRPPLPKIEVEAFERRHAIALPTDYREFLIQVGNGGAGPYYGIFKLGEMDDGHSNAPWKDWFVGAPSKPFPFAEAWNDLIGQPDEDLIETDEDEYQRQLDDFEKSYFKPINGAIPICHIGCALRLWLVVTGPEAGFIWQDDRASDGGLYPIAEEDGDRQTFGVWYQAWLDEALAQLG